MLLAKKCQFFLYLDLVKIRLEIMLNYFEERKETSLTIKKQNIPKSKTSHFVFKRVNPCFWLKYAIFFLSLDLIKIRLEIMLSEFARKRETFFDLKKHNFSKFKKSHVFSKELTHAFGQNMPFFSLFRFDQNKARNNAF